MKVFGKICKCLGMVLCVAGVLWFLLPLVRRGFGIGMIFGIGVCAAGFCLLLYFGRLHQQGGWKRAVAWVFCVCYVLGMGWGAYLTYLMNSAQSKTAPAGTNVMVLGSQVYSIEHLGVALRSRVNKAGEYLLEYPQANCIVTGGQGSNEPCTEAEAERHALLKMGVEKERIFLEDQSTTTRENMAFAKRIANEEGFGDEIVVVTQGFHMYRALMLAENAGFTAYALTADTDPFLFPLYYGRELLSLTKWKIERLFLEK